MKLIVCYVLDCAPKFEADAIFSEFQCYSFSLITFNVWGHSFTPFRQVCAYGEPGLTHSFTGTSVSAKPCTPTLWKLKAGVEKFTGDCFNYDQLNQQKPAKISQHADKNILVNVSIPCLSFGASRKMQFIIPKGKKHILDLNEGSLMVVYPTNSEWKHGIAPQIYVINLTIPVTFLQLIY